MKSVSNWIHHTVKNGICIYCKQAVKEGTYTKKEGDVLLRKPDSKIEECHE